MIAAAINNPHILMDFGGQPRVAPNQLSKAENRVQRRPQFVAHIGEKRAFGAIRVFGGVFGLPQGGFRLFAGGNILMMPQSAIPFLLKINWDEITKARSLMFERNFFGFHRHPLTNDLLNANQRPDWIGIRGFDSLDQGRCGQSPHVLWRTL